ncbi:hypothetical protein BLNAU_20619 [Blattamonas nauphoetae]|uniref:Uncharacterized protein n=1 Tax=Blattamonas nauphoetae TaxID=2049346 RepID=A0ABQ9X1H5_9EUKA|nr:hypothetical protein BLNAU_20619 [Blattamonas nauphoetae]
MCNNSAFLFFSSFTNLPFGIHSLLNNAVQSRPIHLLIPRPLFTTVLQHHTTNPNDAKYEEDHTNDAKYEEDHTNDAKYEEDHTNDAKYEEDHTNDAKYEEDHTNDAKYEEDHTNDAKYEEDHTNDAKYEELRLKLEQKETFDVDLMMSGTKRTGLKNTRISKQEYLRERC